MSGDNLTGTDRDAQASQLRSRIETAAAVLQAAQAEALAAAIEYTRQHLHREVDGFSSIRDWLCETFNLHRNVARNIASIARLAPKFKTLAAAALDGTARIDAVAYAMCRLDTTGLRVVARLPYPDGPQESPYDQAVECPTPETMIREYCIHASHDELREEINRLVALLETAALDNDLSQQSLAWVEVYERGDGLWDLSGLLSDDTGRLLYNYLQTATPPPRQDETDTEGVLPAKPNRDAEALHQLLATAGTDPHAPKRHGHTATLNVTCDLETLQGQDTGRVGTIDGRPAPLEKIRFLACEAAIIPSIYDYERGEVVELGRELRLPNVALRRKLELEQPTGCAWNGCTRPVSWCEAHHLVPWYDGGPTSADNLILVCRFHHGRLHTGRWTATKTGPGTADLRRHGCSDNRPCRDCPTCEVRGLARRPVIGRDLFDVFPTGLEDQEWAPALKTMLGDYQRWAGNETTTSGRTTHRSEPAPVTEDFTAPVTNPPADIYGEQHSEGEPIPFLSRPQRWSVEGESEYRLQAQDPTGTEPLTMSGPGQGRRTAAKPRPQAASSSLMQRPEPTYPQDVSDPHLHEGVRAIQDMWRLRGIL
ncbi:hypothetical protein GCM10027447_29520 [Glycomyces halotolerans]